MAKKKTEAKPVKEKKVNAGRRLIVFLIEVIVLAAGIMLCVTFIKKYNEPKLVAENYYKALLKGDYATAYGYLDLDEEDSEFLTEEAYTAAMKSYQLDTVTDYEITGERKRFTLNYDGDVSGSMEVKAVEQKKKRFLIFKDYKLQMQDGIAENVELYIYTAADMDVKLNGIALNDSNATVNRDDYSTDIVVAKMFAGDYVAEISGEMFQPYSIELNVDTYSTYFYLDTPYIASGVAQTVADLGVTDIQAMYQSAMNGEETCAVLDNYMTHDGTDPENLTDNYDYLRGDMEINDGFFDSMSLNDFSGFVYNYYYDSASGYFNMDIELDFTVEYQYQMLDWWTESYYETYNDTESASANMNYIYQDGEWVLSYLSLYDGIYAY